RQRRGPPDCARHDVVAPIVRRWDELVIVPDAERHRVVTRDVAAAVPSAAHEEADQPGVLAVWIDVPGRTERCAVDLEAVEKLLEGDRPAAAVDLQGARRVRLGRTRALAECEGEGRVTLVEECPAAEAVPGVEARP